MCETALPCGFSENNIVISDGEGPRLCAIFRQVFNFVYMSFNSDNGFFKRLIIGFVFFDHKGNNRTFFCLTFSEIIRGSFTTKEYFFSFIENKSLSFQMKNKITR